MSQIGAQPRLPRVDDPRDRVWVFDLDNTLYPPHVDLFPQVDRRMQSFISEFLKVDLAEAHRLQKYYYRTYGTTLSGLMEEHDPAIADAFLDYVHAIDVTPLLPDPALDRALEALVGRKIVFTNGSEQHAINILDRLQIARHFDGISHIKGGNYVPKPRIEAYDTMLARHGIDATRACMLEDLPRNLVPAHGLGMTTVLILGNHECTDIDAEGPHIHNVTDRLTDWLDFAVATQSANPAD